MRMINRYKESFIKGYKQMSPNVTFRHMIMEEGRMLTREELRDIFDICDAVVSLEKKRYGLVGGELLPMSDIANPCKKIIKYYSKYHGVTINKIAVLVLYAIRNTIFIDNNMPFLVVAYNNIAVPD
jgi:hypothetical protein